MTQTFNIQQRLHRHDTTAISTPILLCKIHSIKTWIQTCPVLCQSTTLNIQLICWINAFTYTGPSTGLNSHSGLHLFLTSPVSLGCRIHRLHLCRGLKPPPMRILDMTLNNLVVWLFGFYGISAFVAYLMPNPFLYKQSVLFQTIQFSISTQFVKSIPISRYSV